MNNEILKGINGTNVLGRMNAKKPFLPEKYGYKKKLFSVQNNALTTRINLFSKTFLEGVSATEAYIEASFSGNNGGDPYSSGVCGGTSGLISGSSGGSYYYACGLDYINGGDIIRGFLGIDQNSYQVAWYDNIKTPWIFSGYVLLPI